MTTPSEIRDSNSVKFKLSKDIRDSNSIMMTTTKRPLGKVYKTHVNKIMDCYSV